MLHNAYFLAKIGADTAENELQFAEILPIGRRVDQGASCAPARTPPTATMNLTGVLVGELREEAPRSSQLPTITQSPLGCAVSYFSLSTEI